jgi:Arc/MetJ family transcription regulator
MAKMDGMKKTLHIDDALLAEAKAAIRATTDTEVVRRGLEALVRHAAHERLRALRGTEPNASDVPRRREAPKSGVKRSPIKRSSKRRAA